MQICTTIRGSQELGLIHNPFVVIGYPLYIKYSWSEEKRIILLKLDLVHKKYKFFAWNSQSLSNIMNKKFIK